MSGWIGPQHAEFWAEQKSKLDNAGLQDRWEYVGSIHRIDKATFLSSIDLFCVPTTYAEPKGLFLLEAIAAGVPYVQPNHGAFPELHQRMQSVDSDHPFGRLFQADSMDDLCAKLLDSIQANLPIETIGNVILNEIDIATHARRVLNVIAGH